jgi:hypothetical protein
MAESVHPLAVMLREAADGVFPAPDGRWRRAPPWRAGLGAIVAFTGHAVIAADGVPEHRLAELGVNGFGGAHDPRVVAELAGPNGWIDSLDLVLVRHGAGRTGTAGAATPGVPAESRLVPRPDLAQHPRVAFSTAVRTDTTVWGYRDPANQTLAAISAGIGGLPEIGFELDADQRGRGAGARLVDDMLQVIPADELVVAAAAPGNTASVRTLLRSRFTPVASIQLFRCGGA